ncbi:DUF6328 family protein [Streptomyces sp. CA-106110]|uniref:DUF6328 family protein n=1 Tax=Streptomyces sp. CA-106110 TaxID=3240044 RepID=UPI003D89B9F1
MEQGHGVGLELGRIDLHHHNRSPSPDPHRGRGQGVHHSGGGSVLATPVALHRGLFHRGAKPRIVALSARYAEAGLMFLALAINGAVLLLMDVVFGHIAAIAITAATTAMFACLWFVLPWSLRRS